MKKYSLFRQLNLGLRAEVIINIAFLMLAAILLIGFTIFKIDERNIVREKVRYAGRMVQDFQSFIDYISQNKKDFSLSQAPVQKEIQRFAQIYIKNKGFDELLLVDAQMNILTSHKPEQIHQPAMHPSMLKAVQTGEFIADIDHSGNLLSIQYKKMNIYAPLWHRGKIAGGVQIESPVQDIMVQLVESRRIIATTIVVDSILLVLFGSFLLSRVLVKPIKDLVQLTEKMGEGDYNQKLEVTAKNEIGQLIHSFNRMTDKIKGNQEDLVKHLDSLETANQQIKQTQEELIRTEKLASIGRFAAGVAHEVGNPIGSILGYTSILQKGEISGEESKDLLMRIEKEIERINRIVRELLDYARPGSFEIKEIEINKVIEGALSLLSYQKNFKNIETRLDLQSGLPMVRGNESQFSQVFINIILNSIDAMPQGGVLEIQTSEHIVNNRELSQVQPAYFPRRKNDPTESNFSHLRTTNASQTYFKKYLQGEHLIKIRISDNGCGIHQEDLKRIFDPFFTTKAPDKGTGLGLSISLRIIESLGGELKVESEEGKGSTFEMYFPAMG